MTTVLETLRSEVNKTRENLAEKRANYATSIDTGQYRDASKEVLEVISIQDILNILTDTHTNYLKTVQNDLVAVRIRKNKLIFVVEQDRKAIENAKAIGETVVVAEEWEEYKRSRKALDKALNYETALIIDIAASKQLIQELDK